jgi:hypothetical protein
VKRPIAIALILTVCLSAYAILAPNRTLGYGASLSGSSSATVDASLNLRHTLLNLPVLTPSLDYSLTLSSSVDGLHIRGIRAQASLTLFRTLEHPMRFVAVNPTAWSPEISAGLDYRFRQGTFWVLEAKVFKFEERDFIYEWVCPYVCFSTTFREVDEWGITLMRFTCLI